MSLTLYTDRLFWGTLWILAHIGLFTWAYLDEYYRQDNQTNKQLLGVFLYLARAAAKCLNFDMACILIPICRNLLSMVQRIPYLGRLLPFDKHIRFHIWIAYTMTFFSIIHTGSHYFNFLLLQDFNSELFSSFQLSLYSWAGTTGQAMNVILILIIASAVTSVRRQAYELFWYIHHLSFFFFVAALLHAVGCILKTDTTKCYEKTTYKWVAMGMGIYLLEVSLRWLRAFKYTYIKKVIQHPSQTYEIQFHKPSMTTRAGQYVFINVSEISKTEWHPFTLTSCEGENFHSVHIRIVGDWTLSLAKRLGCDTKEGQLAAPLKLPTLRIDGPYGTPSETIFDNEISFLVGAGIGVTPFASILKQIWYTVHQPGYNYKLKKVYFMWVCRDTTAFEWFQDLLFHLEKENLDHFLSVHIYLTHLDARMVPNVIVNDTERDAITRLKAQTKFGRPDLPLFFQDIKRKAGLAAGGKKSVGVYFCGPKALGHALRVESHRQSDSQVKFNFYKEVF